MKKTARVAVEQPVDVCESLTSSMTAILTEFSNNNQQKANKIAEQAGVEELLVTKYGTSRDEFAKSSRTTPVVEAPASSGRGRRPGSKNKTTTVARSATPATGGGTQADYILSWFAKQPNQTGGIKALKDHFAEVGRSPNTAAVMVTTLTKAGLLVSKERGIYTRTKKAA